MENQNNNDSVNVTVNKPGKILHFSDGVEEEIVAEHNAELKCEPGSETTEVDPKTLSWGPWFSYYAWKSGTKVLDVVDYAGGSLAGLFGITTPKYQLEIDEYERMKEEKKKMEEESVGWVPQNTSGNIPLVMNEPAKDLTKPADV